MASLAEILKQKRIESRLKITDDVINAVIQSLKTEMITIAEKGGKWGNIYVQDECGKIKNLDLELPFGKKHYVFYHDGRWNWWGLKQKDNPNDDECQWILQKIILKGIFKGIKIGMSRRYKYFIFFMYE